MVEGRRRARPGRWAAWLLSGFVVLAPHLLGGATELTHLLIVAGGALVGLCCAFGVPVARGNAGSLPWAAVAAAVATLWTLVQVLPLPCAWINSVQPMRGALNAELIELGALDAPRCTISIAPGSTVASLSLAATMLSLLLSAVVLSRVGHRRTLSKGFAIGSIVMSCVALGHAILGADAVFGIYVPKQARPQFLLAPLMNENHLAGYIALGFPLCLAFARGSERLESRILWWTAAFVTFASGFLTLSRGGVVALLAGGGAYVFLELRKSASGSRHRRATLGGVAVAIACMSLGGFFAIDLLAPQFAPSPLALQKFDVMRQLGSVALEHPWLGIGRGALVDASTRAIVRNQRVVFAENFFVQWLVEWGVPITLLMLGLLSMSIWKLRPVQRAEGALACGLFALVLQNTVDFSLELAGVAGAAAVAAGVLVARERAPRGTISSPLLPPVDARSALVVAAVASALCVALASPWLTFWARSSLHRTLAEHAGSVTRSGEASPLLSRAFTSYPFDPQFLILGAALAAREDPPLVPRWLNLAFAAAPGWASPHLHAAAFLERHGRLDQAAIELGLAEQLDPRQHATSCAFLKRNPLSHLAWAITPIGATDEQRRRETMTDCLIQTGRWLEADRALTQLLERFPRSEYALRRRVAAAANLGSRELALERAREMNRTLPGTPVSVATLADALTSHGKPEAALRLIDAAPHTVQTSEAVLYAEATAAARLRDEPRLENALKQLLENYGTTAGSRGAVLLFASQQLTVVGNHLSALSRARSAYDFSGDPNALELAHSAAVQAGLLSAALRTAAELCNVGHRGKTFCGKRSQVDRTPQ